MNSGEGNGHSCEHDRGNCMSHHKGQAQEVYGGRTSHENRRLNGDSRFVGGRPLDRDAPVPTQAPPDHTFTVRESVEQEQWRLLMEETPGDTLGSPSVLDPLFSPRLPFG